MNLICREKSVEICEICGKKKLVRIADIHINFNTYFWFKFKRTPIYGNTKQFFSEELQYFWH
jgi:hypothetical protein